MLLILFDEAMCARLGLETHEKPLNVKNHQSRIKIGPALIEYDQKSNLSTVVYLFQHFLVSR